MSDIDFDELDRAVSGALGGNETPAVPEAQTINRVERTSLSSVAPGLAAPIAPVIPAAAPTSTPASTSIAPAARRSSGRFMDMVHPSSDMRSRGLNSSVENRFEKPAQAAPAPVAEAVESPAWNEPLESPFLPDAKVEKRPLGGGDAAAAEANPIVDGFDFQGLLDEPEEELLEAPAPQERIEATTMPDPIDFADAAAEANAVELVEANPMEVEESLKAEEAPVEPEIITTQPQPQPVVETLQPAVEEPVGPTSITPQYKEQASSNQESGAMYDTESYHQAVTAPVKKKSGWFTVLWILLLVLIGAGGGWAVYTYVLPML